MKISNGTIWGAKDPLAQLAREVLPIKTAYWVARLARQVEEHWRLVSELRNKLILQYGTKGEGGNTTISPADANWEPFAKAMNELLGEEVEITINKIKIPADTDARVPATVLLALEDFVEVAE